MTLYLYIYIYLYAYALLNKGGLEKGTSEKESEQVRSDAAREVMYSIGKANLSVALRELSRSGLDGHHQKATVFG